MAHYQRSAVIGPRFVKTLIPPVVNRGAQQPTEHEGQHLQQQHQSVPHAFRLSGPSEESKTPGQSVCRGVIQAQL